LGWGNTINGVTGGCPARCNNASEPAVRVQHLSNSYHYDFGNGFGLTAYGDVGGFGVGAHVDWQLIDPAGAL
jgi:hypothetical protein